MCVNGEGLPGFILGVIVGLVGGGLRLRGVNVRARRVRNIRLAVGLVCHGRRRRRRTPRVKRRPRRCRRRSTRAERRTPFRPLTRRSHRLRAVAVRLLLRAVGLGPHDCLIRLVRHPRDLIQEAPNHTPEPPAADYNLGVRLLDELLEYFDPVADLALLHAEELHLGDGGGDLRLLALEAMVRPEVGVLS